MPPGLLEVGRIDRPHGVRGDVLVTLTTNRPGRLIPGAEFATTHGLLRVRDARPHQRRHIVTFEGVDDREIAEGLRGVVLSAEPLDDPDALWVHELIGAQVVDTSGKALGVVTAVEANPASDLLVLDDTGLVPLHFVVDTAPGRVVVDPPPGLLDP